MICVNMYTSYTYVPGNACYSTHLCIVYLYSPMCGWVCLNTAFISIHPSLHDLAVHVQGILFQWLEQLLVSHFTYICQNLLFSIFALVVLGLNKTCQNFGDS